MDTAEAAALTDVLSRVHQCSQESRIVLARRLLETLEGPQRPARAVRPRSVQQLVGLGAGGCSAPDDDTVRRWIDEHRMEKHG